MIGYGLHYRLKSEMPVQNWHYYCYLKVDSQCHFLAFLIFTYEGAAVGCNLTLRDN